MEKESGTAEAGSHSKEERRRWLAIFLGLICLAGWAAYMLGGQRAAVMTLPGGTTVKFLEAKEGDRGGFLYDDHSGQPTYIQTWVIEDSTYDKIRRQLPRWIDQKLPGKPTPPFRTSGFESSSTHAFWFAVDGPFDPNDWRFFWVDDQGYETEIRHRYFSKGGSWLGVEGNAPRLQSRLHLRVRARKGETRTVTSNVTRGKLPGVGKDAVLGEVAAEMDIRNPLRRKSPATPMTPQTFPAKVFVGGHQLVLKGATRARIASQTSYGLHLDLALEGQPSVTSIFSLRDWTIEDGIGNVMTPSSMVLSASGQLLDCAPWSDSSVWKVRFVPVISELKHFAPDEIVTLDPMPMPTVARLTKSMALTQPSADWHYERTVKGHTLRVEDIQPLGPEEVIFTVTVTPAIHGRTLQLMHAVDETGSQTYEDTYGRQTYVPFSPLRLDEQASTSTRLIGRCHRPAAGTTLTLTLAFKEVTPVEFTFQPEFEP